MAELLFQQGGSSAVESPPSKVDAIQADTAEDDTLGIPHNFALVESSARGKPGVYQKKLLRDVSDSWDWVRICSPIRVEALARNNGRTWSKLTRFKDRDGREHEYLVEDRLLASKSGAEQVRTELADRGLEIEPSQFAHAGLTAYLTKCIPSARSVVIRRTGWHGPAFVLPDETIGHLPSNDQIVYAPFREHQNHYRVAADDPEGWRDWRDNVGILCRANSRLTLGVSTAFAAPLLELLGEKESGGANLFGPSSIGKTSVADTAGSVCGGGGVLRYKVTWRATSNALESVCVEHCDTLLVIDEMAEVAATEASQIAYMIAGGQTKRRANRDGSGRDVQTWRVLFLSTSETTLADKIRQDPRGTDTAGTAVRVLDIPADAGGKFGVFENLHGSPDGAEFSRRLYTNIDQFYGAPFREYLRQLTDDLEGSIAAVHDTRSEFIRRHAKPGDDGQVRRALARLALIAAAGELATEMTLTGWELGEASAAISKCYDSWITHRGGHGKLEITKLLSQIRRTIEQHGESRFEPIEGYPEGRATLNRLGFRRLIEGNGYQYLVMPEGFKELCAGFDPSDAKQILKREGLLLVTDKEGKFSTSIKVPALGDRNVRLYVLSPNILDEEDKH
jgi:putative DNA primase/helicase